MDKETETERKTEKNIEIPHLILKEEEPQEWICRRRDEI
jgi:hypothetical protein